LSVLLGVEDDIPMLATDSNVIFKDPPTSHHVVYEKAYTPDVIVILETGVELTTLSVSAVSWLNCTFTVAPTPTDWELPIVLSSTTLSKIMLFDVTEFDPIDVTPLELTVTGPVRAVAVGAEAELPKTTDPGVIVCSLLKDTPAVLLMSALVTDKFTMLSVATVIPVGKDPVASFESEIAAELLMSESVIREVVAVGVPCVIK